MPYGEHLVLGIIHACMSVCKSGLIVLKITGTFSIYNRCAVFWQ